VKRGLALAGGASAGGMGQQRWRVKGSKGYGFWGNKKGFGWVIRLVGELEGVLLHVVIAEGETQYGNTSFSCSGDREEKASWGAGTLNVGWLRMDVMGREAGAGVASV